MRTGTITRPMTGENGTCALPSCDHEGEVRRVTKTGIVMLYCKPCAELARRLFDADMGEAV